MHLKISLVNGELIEQTVDSNICIIGRSAKCDVVIPHDGMSRQHCQIEVLNGEVFITDLGSTNGVIIDGEKIEAHQKIPYATYLSLSFGAVQSLQVELEEMKGGNFAPRATATVGSENATTQTHLGKTRPMRDVGRADARPMPKRAGPSKEEKIKSWATNILVVLILAATAWWYIQKDEVAPDVYESAPTSAPEETQKTYDQF